MAQNTIRLHLNSNDAVLQTVDGVKNHANATFDLSRAGIHAVADQMLSIALVKAVIPTQTTSIGYDNSKPAFEIGTTKIYITSQELVYPNPSAPAIAKFPLTYIQGPADLLNQLNRIIGITTPGSFLIIDDVNGSLTLYGAGPVVIQNKYFQKDQPEFSLIGEKIAQCLGINTDTTLATTEFGAAPVNLTTQYSVALALPPLKLATNLGLDSVVSKGSLNSILSNIPITVANQSQKLDIVPELVPPFPPVLAAAPPTHMLTVANHPYTPALNGDYISIGNYYRDPSPPRYFKESLDHHLFRRDTDDNTYLLFSYGIHQTATWYIGIYPLLSTTVDYLSNNHTSLGQISQHSIGTGWNAFTGGGIGNYPSAAYTPSHTLTAVFS